MPKLNNTLMAFSLLATTEDTATPNSFCLFNGTSQLLQKQRLYFYQKEEEKVEKRKKGHCANDRAVPCRLIAAGWPTDRAVRPKIQ